MPVSQVSLLFFVNIHFIVNVLRNGVMEVVLFVDILKNEMHLIKLVNLTDVNLVMQQKIYGYGIFNFNFCVINDSLICGHIGCGRYNGAHAFDHYLSTKHLYALELETQRVWDYTGDGYVHRLIQTKSDGKLVEFPPVASTGTYYHPADRAGGGDDVSNEKLDAMGMEYTYLLTTQLESQRVYYEERITAAADKAAEASKAADQANSQISHLEKQLEQATLQLRKLQAEKENLVHSLAENIKAKDRTEAKCVKLTETARNWQKDLKEEKVLTEGLMVKVKALSGEKQVLVNEKNELQEQNQDLMFMLENMGREDIKGGDVGVAQQQQPKKGSRRARK
jgi:BRCA1-associated protein